MQMLQGPKSNVLTKNLVANLIAIRSQLSCLCCPFLFCIISLKEDELGSAYFVVKLDTSTVKPVLSGHRKLDKTKFLLTN